jgi:hypothetical protein
MQPSDLNEFRRSAANAALLFLRMSIAISLVACAWLIGLPLLTDGSVVVSPAAVCLLSSMLMSLRLHHRLGSQFGMPDPAPLSVPT